MFSKLFLSKRTIDGIFMGYGSNHLSHEINRGVKFHAP